MKQQIEEENKMNKSKTRTPQITATYGKVDKILEKDEGCEKLIKNY